MIDFEESALQIICYLANLGHAVQFFQLCSCSSALENSVVL